MAAKKKTSKKPTKSPKKGTKTLAKKKTPKKATKTVAKKVQPKRKNTPKPGVNTESQLPEQAAAPTEPVTIN